MLRLARVCERYAIVRSIRCNEVAHPAILRLRSINYVRLHDEVSINNSLAMVLEQLAPLTFQRVHFNAVTAPPFQCWRMQIDSIIQPEGAMAIVGKWPTNNFANSINLYPS